VLPERHQLRVTHAHGPGAAARNARKRFSAPALAPSSAPAALGLAGLEIRDLAVYEELLEVA
jgi:hypothetical protein